jgi:hypothetical protein
VNPNLTDFRIFSALGPGDVSVCLPRVLVALEAWRAAFGFPVQELR